jgi:putative sigma-54 modulation protein
MNSLKFKEDPMRITLTARHFKPSANLKKHAENKVAALNKYYDGILDVDIILDFVKQEQVAEIIAKVHSTSLTAVEKSEDMYKSIDLAVEKLERQIKKYKGKLRQHSNDRIASEMV